MSDREAIRREVVRRLRGRVIFFAHLMFFALTFITETSKSPRPIDGAFFVWGAILLLHANRTFGWWDKLVERAVDREVSRRNATYAVVSEKPKRDVRLSDDGELEYIEENIPNRHKSSQ